MDEQTPSDEPTVPRVIDRLREARMSDERIQLHMTAGSIRVDGEAVTDLDQPAPKDARLVIAPS